MEADVIGRIVSDAAVKFYSGLERSGPKVVPQVSGPVGYELDN